MRNFTKKLSVASLFLIATIFDGFSQISGTSSTLSVTNNVATVVDNALTITATGNITDMTVQITNGYVSGASGDILGYTSGSLPSGVTGSYDNARGVLIFSGTASPANWQTLLRTVTLKSTSATCYANKRTVTFVIGDKYYNPITDHYYEIASASTWTAAKSNASASSYLGMQGYLATITSAGENNFVWKIMSTNTWIGCSDNYSQINAATGVTTYANQTASDGNFYWVTGPEAGTQFSQKNAWASGGVTAVSGNYMNWESGEPNDYPGLTSATPGEEDYGHMYSSTNGTWNDYPNTSTLPSMIEYGDMPNDATTGNIGYSSRNINISGAAGGTITGGGGSVCSGSSSTVLTITGLTGTVVRWEYSYDNFLTIGGTISNTTTTYTVSNITQTTYYRAVVNSTTPSCSNLAISSTVVNVLTTVPGNITAASSTICATGNVYLTLSGNQGSVLKWQKSTSSTFVSGNTDIANTTVSLTQAIASAGTYYYRAQVQNGGCGVPIYSSGITITVTSGTPSVGGTVSNMAFCGGSNSGTLTLTGKTGNVNKWQTSVDNGIVWSDITNTTTSLSFSSISATTLYRAVVQNGSCPAENSANGMAEITNTNGTWLGNTSSNWQTAANWCGGVPTSTTNVIIPSGRMNNPSLSSSIGYCNNISIYAAATLTVTSTLQVYGAITQNGTFTASGGTISFNGSSAQTIPASTFASNTIQNLTIANSSGVTLSGAQTVTGTLTFSSGLLNTSGANLLTMASGSSAISGASSSKYINGPVKKAGTSAFIFHIGKGGKYAPCEISAPSTSTEFTAEYFNTSYSNITVSPGLLNVSFKEYWNIDRNTGTAAVNLSLYYYDPAFSGILYPSPANVVVAHFNSGTNHWEDLASGTKSATTTKVTMNNVNSFSPFTFGSPSGFNPLPVKLISFDALPDYSNKTVELKWQTTSEQNCGHFEVLYSNDETNWTNLNDVNCQGPGNQMNSYSFNHLETAPINFYRLNEIDKDGNSSLSETRSVYFNHTVSDIIKIYPNPSIGNFVIEKSNAMHKAGNAGYEIFDDQGKLIQSGNFSETVEIQNLPKGIYMLKVVSSGIIKNEKIIIQ